MSWSSRRRLALIRDDAVALDEVVDVEAFAAGELEDGEALGGDILSGGGDAQIGDGFHVLSMESCRTY